MKLADEISYRLIGWVHGGGYEIVIPNFYYGIFEMDLFRLMPSELVYEYEIKISRSDFFNDFKKGFGSTKKHESIKNKQSICNKFYFVTPENLVSIDEVPGYAGLIYYNGYTFNTVKPAPLIHKNKDKIGVSLYRSIAKSLAFREQAHRVKLRRVMSQYSERRAEKSN